MNMNTITAPMMIHGGMGWMPVSVKWGWARLTIRSITHGRVGLGAVWFGGECRVIR